MSSVIDYVIMQLRLVGSFAPLDPQAVANQLQAENAALKAELAAMEQAITDPENQPSQFGTVTLAYHEKELAAAQKDATYWKDAYTSNNQQWQARYCEVSEQLDAAQKDAERLAFVESRAYVGVNPHAKTCLWVLRGIYELPGQGFRAAIDKEIAKK